MRQPTLAAAALALLAVLAGAQPIAFEDVAVVPMDRPGILAHHNVVVRGGRIVCLGPVATTPIPVAARRIDGRGKFLMPALVDMHVHLTDRAELLLYVAHGVATVRNMWGGPDTLALRDRIERGALLGPRIFTTGPILDGANPRWRSSEILHTPDDATNAVQRHVDLGYDAIKVYDGLSADVYSALVAAADTADLPVVGHVPRAVGMAGVLAGGQRSIEHLRGYLSLPDDQIGAMIRRTVEAGAWNCVTLVVHDLPYRALRDLPAARRAPEVRLVPPPIRARWDPRHDARFGGLTEMDDAHWRAHTARMEKLHGIVRGLHDAGAPIVLGTDAPNPFVVPGYSAHQELAALVDAGLTPFEALRAGTHDAARLLGRAAVAGSVRAGNEADLVLLALDPLQDIGATQQRAGVMVRGCWFEQSELEQRLQALVREYDQPTDWFDGMAALPEGAQQQFAVMWNETPIGATRLVWAGTPDHRRALHCQSALRDQFDLVRLDTVRSTSGRIQQLKITVRRGARQGTLSVEHDGARVRAHGDLPDGGKIDVTQPARREALLGAGILPHAFVFADRLAALAPGADVAFTLRTPELDTAFAMSTTAVEARREPDTTRTLAGARVAVRRYRLRLTTGSATTPGSLTVTEDGLPATIELIFETGRKVFRRST